MVQCEAPLTTKDELDPDFAGEFETLIEYFDTIRPFQVVYIKGLLFLSAPAPQGVGYREWHDGVLS